MTATVSFGERLIGYGHIVSDDASAVRATTWFVQLDDRAAAETFVANDPVGRAGVYDKTDIRRWSNSFLKRAADYKRKGMQQYLCTGSKIPDAAAFFAQLADAPATPSPLGLQLLIPDMPTKAANLARNVAEDRVRVVRCVSDAV